jgi:hypothetical protein
MVHRMSQRATIEIFRTGRHTAMNGTTIDFTAADLAGMASSYDRSVFDAPIVVGHPKQDGPAYAWCEGVRVDGDKLLADVTDIDPAFAELVKAKRFKKVSAAFYAPDDSNNPKPGNYYLRHVGMLGAAAPAVKGLKEVAFADDGSTVLEFADMRDVSWPLSNIGSALRGIRDFIISKFDLETANAVLPDWTIQSIDDAATQMRSPPSPSYIEQPPENVNVKTLEQREADLAQREADLAQRATVVYGKETQFAEAAAKARGQADAALVEALEAKGHLAPGIRTELLNFMAQLDGGTELAFAEGADAPKLTAHAFFTDLLKTKTGKVIAFGEVAPASKEAKLLTGDAEKDAQRIAADALAYVEEQKAKGVTVAIDQAVDHIRNQEKQ